MGNVYTMSKVDDAYSNIVKQGLDMLRQNHATADSIRRVEKELINGNYYWVVMQYRHLIIGVMYRNKVTEAGLIRALKDKEYIDMVRFKDGTQFQMSVIDIYQKMLANELIACSSKEFDTTGWRGSEQPGYTDSIEYFNHVIYRIIQSEKIRFGVSNEFIQYMLRSVNTHEIYKGHLNYAMLLFENIRSETWRKAVGNKIPRDLDSDTILDILARLLISKVLTNNAIAKLNMFYNEVELREAFALNIIARALNTDKFIQEEYN